MTALVAVETVLLVLMLLLVAGLLRSHAEILRRLEARGDGAPEAPPGPEVTPRRASDAPAFDVSGVTLQRDPVGVAVRAVAHDTLLAFLSSGCLTCRGFWDALRDGPAAVPGGARLVIVTKDPSHESPTKLRALAPSDVPVVMSTRAYDDYDVPMSPYFVYVDGASGTIAGEGTAQTWAQVTSLVADALDDAAAGNRAPERSGGELAAARERAPERFERADAELAAAGITPEHPSLYQADDPAMLRRLDVIDES